MKMTTHSRSGFKGTVKSHGRRDEAGEAVPKGVERSYSRSRAWDMAEAGSDPVCIQSKVLVGSLLTLWSSGVLYS